VAFSFAGPMFGQMSRFSETDMVVVRSRLEIFRVRAELKTPPDLAEDPDIQVLMAFEMV
jgi:hypothetical protein